MVVSRRGLRDHEALAAVFDPVTVEFEADDHKACYQSSHRIRMRFTGDRTTGRLLGAQLFGHRHADVAKRIDIVARLLTERYFSGQVVVVPASEPRQALSEIIHQWVDCSMPSSFIEAVEGP